MFHRRQERRLGRELPIMFQTPLGPGGHDSSGCLEELFGDIRKHSQHTKQVFPEQMTRLWWWWQARQQTAPRRCSPALPLTRWSGNPASEIQARGHRTSMKLGSISRSTTSPLGTQYRPRRRVSWISSGRCRQSISVSGNPGKLKTRKSWQCACGAKTSRISLGIKLDH